MDPALAYPSLVYAHILLFAVWLGGDIGVFALGQHFRKHDAYALETRLVLLKLLVLVDMAPRTAWALMAPVSISMAVAGGWTQLPLWFVAASWAAGLVWLALTWAAYTAGETPRANALRRIAWPFPPGFLALFAGFAAAGFSGWVEMPPWLAAKAALFALIFAVAIQIDIAGKPVVPLLQRLIENGSSPETEVPLLAAMNRVRVWVLGLYVLLAVIAAVGTFKPVW